MRVALLYCLCLLNVAAFEFKRQLIMSVLPENMVALDKKQQIIPSHGIINYIGITATDNGPRWSTDEMEFEEPTQKQIRTTRFNLWKQFPWKKIKGKVILKAKISGSLPLDGGGGRGGPFGLGGKADLEAIESLSQLQSLLLYAAVDPRVQAIFIKIG